MTKSTTLTYADLPFAHMHDKLVPNLPAKSLYASRRLISPWVPFGVLSPNNRDSVLSGPGVWIA